MWLSLPVNIRQILLIGGLTVLLSVLYFFLSKNIIRKAGPAFQKIFRDDPIKIMRPLAGTLYIVLLGFACSIIVPFLKMTDKTAGLVNKGILVISLVFAGLLLSRAVGEITVQIRPSGSDRPPASTIYKNLIGVILMAVVILVILQTLGISITPLITAMGIGGLAIALAMQETLSNLFAGFTVIVTRKVIKGEYVRLDSGEEGYVLDTNWRHTKIRALSNYVHFIPNAKLASSVITNYDRPESEMSVLVNLGVDYTSDLEKTERITIEVAGEVLRDVQGGVPEFSPFIRYNQFADFSINFTVILRAKTFVDQYLLKHEFIKRLKKRYDAEGIVIPFPIRTVYMPKQD